MKITNQIIKKIKSMDSFGDPISFTINKEETSKTFLGGILSTILIISMFTLFGFQVSDSFAKQNPNISSFIKFKNKVDSMNLTKSEFPFAFAVKDEDGFSYHDMITLKATMYTYEVIKGDWIITTKDQILVDCTKDFFPLLDEKSFIDYGYEKYKCIKDQNITLDGFVSDVKYTTLAFDVKYCDDTELKNNNCKIETKKKALLKKGLSTIYFSLHFLNNIFDIMNYTQPLQNYTESMFTYLDIDKIKYSTIFFNRHNLITDDGLISSNKNNQTIISLETFRWDVVNSYYDPNLMAQVYVHPSNREYTSIRTYNKVHSVMAEIMALHEYLKFGLKLFMLVFTNSRKNLKLMNNLFEFDLKIPNSKIKKNKIFSQSFQDQMNPKFNPNKSNQFIKINSFNISKDESVLNKDSSFTLKKGEKINNEQCSDQSAERNDVSFNSRVIISRKKLFNENCHKRDNGEIPITIDNSTINNNLKSLNDNKYVYVKTRIKQKKKECIDFCSIRSKIKEKKRLHLSIREIIQVTLLNCFIKDKKLKDKHELYKMAEEKMEERFEINFVMNKLEEVEKLKTIIFNKEQLCVFNMSSKEILSLNSENTKNYKYNELKEFKSDPKRINQVIEKLKERLLNHSEDLTEVDKKLLSLLPSEIKEIIIDKNIYN